MHGVSGGGGDGVVWSCSWEARVLGQSQESQLCVHVGIGVFFGIPVS